MVSTRTRAQAHKSIRVQEHVTFRKTGTGKGIYETLKQLADVELAVAAVRKARKEFSTQSMQTMVDVTALMNEREESRKRRLVFVRGVADLHRKYEDAKRLRKEASTAVEEALTRNNASEIMRARQIEDMAIARELAAAGREGAVQMQDTAMKMEEERMARDMVVRLSKGTDGVELAGADVAHMNHLLTDAIVATEMARK